MLLHVGCGLKGQKGNCREFKECRIERTGLASAMNSTETHRNVFIYKNQVRAIAGFLVRIFSDCNNTKALKKSGNGRIKKKIEALTRYSRPT